MLRALSVLVCVAVVGCSSAPRPVDGSWVICDATGAPISDEPLVTLVAAGADDLACTLHADGAHGSRTQDVVTTLRRDGADSWTSDPMPVDEPVQVPVLEQGRLAGHRPVVGPLLVLVFDLGVEGAHEAELRVATEMDGVLRFPLRRRR